VGIPELNLQYSEAEAEGRERRRKNEEEEINLVSQRFNGVAKLF
jgi:hypothetical protein